MRLVPRRNRHRRSDMNIQIKRAAMACSPKFKPKSRSEPDFRTQVMKTAGADCPAHRLPRDPSLFEIARACTSTAEGTEQAGWPW